MEAKDIIIAQKAMDEMHAEGAFNTDLFYILEEEGPTIFHPPEL